MTASPVELKERNRKQMDDTKDVVVLHSAPSPGEIRRNLNKSNTCFVLVLFISDWIQIQLYKQSFLPYFLFIDKERFLSKSRLGFVLIQVLHPPEAACEGCPTTTSLDWFLIGIKLHIMMKLVAALWWRLVFKRQILAPARDDTSDVSSQQNSESYTR